MDELAARLAREIQEIRASRDESRETESYIAGIKRAMVIAAGDEHARRVLAEHDEAY